MQYALGIVSQRKSEVMRVWLGNYLVTAIINPKDIEVIKFVLSFWKKCQFCNFQMILGSNVHLEKSPEYKLFEPWLGDGLLISKGRISKIF